MELPLLGGPREKPDKPGVQDPPLPAGDVENPPRANMRPKATEMKPREGLAPQNVLRGEVISGVTAKPALKVDVVFSDLSHRGHNLERKRPTWMVAFEIVLPTGDWSI